MTDREKLIEHLRWWAKGCDRTNSGCQVNLLLEKAADELANGVTVQKWIPVTERLPQICEKDPEWSQTVLFRTEQGHIHSGYRNSGKPQTSFYDDDWYPAYWLDESENLSFEEDEVTHWMPLTEPPKGGE